MFLRERKCPLSSTLRMSLSVASCITGPRNWQPRLRTAVQSSVEICCWFWCSTNSSVTVRSATERAARSARARPSVSSIWQLTTVTSFLSMGRVRWVPDMAVAPPCSAKGCRKNTSSLTARAAMRYCSRASSERPSLLERSVLPSSSSWSRRESRAWLGGRDSASGLMAALS